MNDLQEEHWPSLQPCMSMIPCSNAARRIVWSSLTSISMPTGSNRTTCLSAIAPSPAGRGEARGLDPRTPSLGFLAVTGCPSGLRRGRPAGRSLAVVVRLERRALFRRHLVEQDVRALHRGHPAQVVQRPHLLLVAQM